MVAPVVGLSDEGAGDEGLHQQVDVQVGNLSQDVVVAVDVLLGNKNTLWKRAMSGNFIGKYYSNL